MVILFWSSLILFIYVYFLYPMVLVIINRFSEKGIKREEDFLPTVSLIISAYNEADIIEKKIENSLNLDYPEDRMEFLVASDGSTDNTAGLVKKYKNIKIMDYKQNEGKTQTQNKAVKESRGEILVFSDANSMYKKDAIRKLVRNFVDEKVGAVCGELQYNNSRDTGTGRGIGLYKRYQIFLKRLESIIHSTIVAYGSIYAIRKDLFTPLPADIFSDFFEPLMFFRKGYRRIYDK